MILKPPTPELLIDPIIPLHNWGTSILSGELLIIERGLMQSHFSTTHPLSILIPYKRSHVFGICVTFGVGCV